MTARQALYFGAERIRSIPFPGSDWQTTTDGISSQKLLALAGWHEDAQVSGTPAIYPISYKYTEGVPAICSCLTTGQRLARWNVPVHEHLGLAPPDQPMQTAADPLCLRLQEHRLAIVSLQIVCSHQGKIENTDLSYLAQWRQRGKITALKVLSSLRLS